MTDFTKGKWIEWTGSDDDGTFAHVGQITSKSKTSVTFASPEGEITAELDDGEFKNVKARKTSKKSTVAPPAPPMPVRDLKVNAPKELSAKMVQVIELVKANPDLARKDYIQLIVTQVGMSAGGASTYYNTARKHV